MAKRIGLVVDLQQDFVLPQGALYIPGADDKIQKYNKAVDFMYHSADFVLFTTDWHVPEDEELSDHPDLITTFPAHCMKNSLGALIIPTIAPIGDSRRITTLDRDSNPHGAALDLHGTRQGIIRKNRFNVFDGNPQFETFLKALGGNPEFLVCGVATDVCVTAAVEGLRERGYSVTVLIDACHGLGIVSDEEIFNRWKLLGVRMGTTEQLR